MAEKEIKNGHGYKIVDPSKNADGEVMRLHDSTDIQACQGQLEALSTARPDDAPAGTTIGAPGEGEALIDSFMDRVDKTPYVKGQGQASGATDIAQAGNPADLGIELAFMKLAAPAALDTYFKKCEEGGKDE